MNGIFTMNKNSHRGRQQAPASAGAARPKPLLSLEFTMKADQRRAALRRLMATHALKPTDLARLIQAPNANLFYNFLNGHSHSLSQDTLERLSAAFPNSSIGDFIGPAQPRLTVCRIVAETCPGQEQAGFALPAARQRLLPLPAGVWDEIPGLFGVLVGSSGPDQLHPAGSILLCRPLGGRDGVPPAGCRVVVQRPLGAGVEVTVRRLVVDPTEVRFSDPARSDLLWPVHSAAGQTEDDSIVIAGIVIASWQPELRP